MAKGNREAKMQVQRDGITRRSFLGLATSSVAAALVGCNSGPESAAERSLLRLETSTTAAAVPVMTWDTEGGSRLSTNLLRAPIVLRVLIAGTWYTSAELTATREATTGGGIRFRINAIGNAELIWDINSSLASPVFMLSARGTDLNRVEAVELVFPLDPRVTPTTVLPAEWADDGTLGLPAIISAPDFGQMLMTDVASPNITGRLEGSRTDGTADFVLDLSTVLRSGSSALSMAPVQLRAPQGLNDVAMWRKVRRGWFNSWQLSARWGPQDNPVSAPAGILANNVISDPVSFSLRFQADHALWFPMAAPGISVAAIVRRSLEWWLDHRMSATGEVVGYWNISNFLDANAAMLTAAWVYAESTGDEDWLTTRMPQLELVSEFLAQRDVDGDGIVEATQSGNYGTLAVPARSCNWYDALNCGHKDGYSNALIYRAWRCLAELEHRLQRPSAALRYTQLADRLKAAYSPTLFNPATGWLAWWKSEDGVLHDYATPIVNGMAIEYGLVDPAQGRAILQRLWAKIEAAGFNRFDLGVPSILIPALRADYIIDPGGYSVPRRDDGTDTFGIYENGGITASHVGHFLAAHYVVGTPERADALLNAMVERQVTTGFQNGVRNQFPAGIDWTTWDGQPSGYEGYLADVYGFLLAVLLREPLFRARYYRPLTPRLDRPFRKFALERDF